MPDMTFNTPEGQTIARKLLILALNTGTKETPVWSPLGVRVTDSSAEMDWGKETYTDIFGNVYTTLKVPTISQPFDPWPLVNGDAAQMKIWLAAIKNQDPQALANMDVLRIHAYAGTAETAVFAERYDTSTVEVTTLGGAGGGDLNMATTVTFGGQRIVGTAAVKGGSITFTAGGAAA